MSGPPTPRDREIDGTHHFTRFGSTFGHLTYCVRCGLQLSPGLIAATLPPCGEPLTHRAPAPKSSGGSPSPR